MISLKKGSAILALLIVSICVPLHVAGAQAESGPPLTSAKLCLHNGGDAYVNNPLHGFPNEGGGRYFPSFTHWTATPNEYGNCPWKIHGWCWSGMQGKLPISNWYWAACLQKSMDNPYSPSMSFDYPALYCTGQVSHHGLPMPIYGGAVPTSIPVLGVSGFLFPSSMGGFDAHLNIFAAAAASWIIPSTQSFYAYDFAFVWDCASAFTVPSAYSIWEHVWVQKGPANQYLVLSNDEIDCLGAPGNKGRCYSLPNNYDGSYLMYWHNACNGVGVEWAMCLFVCDAVTMPVNVPGTANPTNPYSAYGFDVGIATLTPLLSSGCVSLGFMTEDGKGIGGGRVVLAAFAGAPCIGPYGKNKYRVPHGFDVLTTLTIGAAPLFMHYPGPGYPACMYGTTQGAHSNCIPFPPDPALLCAEIRYSSFATNPGMPMSASFMATYF